MALAAVTVPSLFHDPATPRQATVLVAARTLEPGTRLAASDLERRPWPGALPKGVAPVPVGEVVHERILVGEPIRSERLAARGGVVAGQLDADELAVLIAPDAVAVPAGVQPGDRIELAVRTATGVELLGGSARVLEADEGLLVAARHDVAPTVAAAGAEGTLLVLLAPAG
jgi:Flp pilus assembly protein CpaB